MTHSNAYSALTEAQRDGRACLYCGGEDGPMVAMLTPPMDGFGDLLDTVQLFAHECCRLRPPRPEPAHVDAANRIVWKLEQLVKDHSITAAGRELARTALADARAVYDYVRRPADVP